MTNYHNIESRFWEEENYTIENLTQYKIQATAYDIAESILENPTNSDIKRITRILTNFLINDYAPNDKMYLIESL